MVLTLSMLLVMFLVVGCEDQKASKHDIYATSQPSEGVYAKGKPVLEARAIKELFKNNLELSEIKEESDGISIVYSEYGGLKSETVTDKINSDIKIGVEDIRAKLMPETIANYRGIKALIKEDSKVSSLYVNAYESFSYNNLLSIQIYGFSDLETKDRRVAVSVAKHLNFDLNSGDEILLKDIFVDGYDYQSVINAFILEKIGQENMSEETNEFYGYNPVKLVAPFDGIDENQAFGLSEQGLIIYFSETDPRFESSFTSFYVYIDYSQFGDHLALDERYVLSESMLFENEIKQRVFSWWPGGILFQSEYLDGEIDTGKWYLNYTTTGDMKDPMLLAWVDQTIEKIELMTLEGTENAIDASIYMSRIGGYTNYNRRMWIHENNTDRTVSEDLVFDDKGDVLLLEDAFVKGYDYSPVIFHELKVVAQGYGSFSNVALMNALETSLQFSIDRDSFRFSMSSPDRDITREDIFWSVPYVEFGYENLTIFD